MFESIDKERKTRTESFAEGNDRSKCALLCTAIGSRQFIGLYIMAVLSFFIGSFNVSNYKTWGLDIGFDDTFLTYLGSAGSIFNGLRFLWSTALDHVRFKIVYGTLICLNIVFGILIVVFRENAVLYAICYCMLIFCEGGHFTIMPNQLKALFGMQATTLYGVLFSFASVDSVILIPL